MSKLLIPITYLWRFIFRDNIVLLILFLYFYISTPPPPHPTQKKKEKNECAEKEILMDMGLFPLGGVWKAFEIKLSSKQCISVAFAGAVCVCVFYNDQCICCFSCFFKVDCLDFCKRQGKVLFN